MAGKPYLLINQSTGGGLDPVSRSYIHAIVRLAAITAQDLRADRRHDEAHATGGDPLRLARCSGSATRPLSGTAS